MNARKTSTQETTQESSTANLKFVKCHTEEQVKRLYQYDVDVFAEAGDFNWSIENLRLELSQGWEIYSVELNTEIISAVFIKFEGDILHTKNTSLKMPYQGQGLSHRMKEFFELFAKSHGAREIHHVCAVDNFRAIALNESHGYKRVGTQKNGEVLDWKKVLKA
jgi:RimJ/RimL family protein N-acetyltransferase